MVAKITVAKASNMVQTGVPGRLIDLSFAINNFNESSFLVQGAAPEYKDPNWEADDNYYESQFSQAGPDDYELVNKAEDADLNSLYAAENTSQNHTMGEITRVTVRAAFIPDSIMVYKNGIDNTEGYITSSSAEITAPRTFWMVTLYRPNPEIAIFYDEDIAENYAQYYGSTADKVEVVPFTDGLCYWDIFLNEDGEWDVIRNDYYRSTITQITVPGRPGVGVTHPDFPPAVKTDITIKIDVLPWESVENNYDLVL
jgi:hypothetical protein